METPAARTLLDWSTALPGLDPTVTGRDPGLTDGTSLLNGDLIAWFRWFSVLKNYSLTLGTTSAEMWRTATIFQRPR